jgi:hypothetical protein
MLLEFLSSMVNWVLVEEDEDLMGRGDEGGRRRLAREEDEEEEDFFLFFSFLEPAERALTEASFLIAFLGALLPFRHLLSGTRLASWLLPFDGTRDTELSVSKRDSTGKSLAAQKHVREEIQTKK